MIELIPFNETVTGIKTATAQDGNPIMWVYSYKIGNVLFDAGCANAVGDLRARGVGSQIDRVYLTHEHEDHVGGCSYFAREASVYAPKPTIELLKDPPDYGEFFRFVWGQPEPVAEVKSLPSRFSIGEHEFKVIPLPGHGKEMVGFYEEKDGWLFSADAVPLPSKKKMAMNDENIPQMISTMEKLLKLDAKVLFDSHRGPIASPGEHIKVRIDYLKELRTKAKALHDEGKSETEIQAALELEGPWYLEYTRGRFGIDLFIKSLIFDRDT
jgi:glyoxylase-like metal-dependent hydrolase (beta-lactamase superfamily II)